MGGKITTLAKGQFAERYLESNKHVYDVLADEYGKRVENDFPNDAPLVERVWSAVRKRHAETINVLDLGCGHGVNLAMFSSLGAIVTGLDFSSNMVAIARKTSPRSTVLNEEFLSSRLPKQNYHLVFAKAFIHLFPREVCPSVFQKIRSLIAPGGLCYIATTLADESSEGYLPKSDYPGNLWRFRRQWARQDLLEFLECYHFHVVDEWINEETRNNKRWLNLLVEAE